ncbi:hypothetical protein OAU13_00035 [bacterium]|nr:hypothetical protein [bacterium]
MENELNERVFAAYRNAWVETLNQLLVVKTQCDLLNEKLREKDEEIIKLQKQIEALRITKPAQQAPKVEVKQ